MLVGVHESKFAKAQGYVRATKGTLDGNTDTNKHPLGLNSSNMYCQQWDLNTGHSNCKSTVSHMTKRTKQILIWNSDVI